MRPLALLAILALTACASVPLTPEQSARRAALHDAQSREDAREWWMQRQIKQAEGR